MDCPKYIDIEINPDMVTPEYYGDWIALILDLIKEIKGTDNYYELSALSILDIVGDATNAMSLSDLSKLIKKLQSAVEASTEEVSDLSDLVNALAKQVTINKTNIDILQQNYGKILVRVDIMEAKVNTNTSNIAIHETKIANIINVEIPRMDNKINTNTSNITVNKKDIDDLKSRTTDAEFRKHVFWNVNSERRVKSITIYMDGNTVNNLNHLCQLQIVNHAGTNRNVSSNCTVTSSTTITGEENLFDENTTSYATFGSGKQWIKFTLNYTYADIEYIHFWTPHNDTRYYNNVEVYVGDGHTHAGNEECIYRVSQDNATWSSSYGRRIYIHNTSFKTDLDIDTNKTNIASNLSRIKAVETRATNLETRATNLETRATNLETRATALEVKTSDENFKEEVGRNSSRHYYVRYIRLWLQIDSNLENKIYNFNVVDKDGVDRARGLQPTCSNTSITTEELLKATDGDSKTFANIGTGTQWIQITLPNDLVINHIIDYVDVLPGTSVNYSIFKLTVSMNGTTWHTIGESDKDNDPKGIGRFRALQRRRFYLNNSGEFIDRKIDSHDNELSKQGGRLTTLEARTTDAEFRRQVRTNSCNFCDNMRYVRINMGGTSESGGSNVNELSEVEIMSITGQNYCRSTCTFTGTAGVVNSAALYDGETRTNICSFGAGQQSLTIQMDGGSALIEYIHIWHPDRNYYYKNMTVEVSSNGTEWEMISGRPVYTTSGWLYGKNIYGHRIYINQINKVIEDNITKNKNDITALTTRVTNLETRMTNAEKRITVNETNIANLSKQMDNLFIAGENLWLNSTFQLFKNTGLIDYLDKSATVQAERSEQILCMGYPSLKITGRAGVTSTTWTDYISYDETERSTTNGLIIPAKILTNEKIVFSTYFRKESSTANFRIVISVRAMKGNIELVRQTTTFFHSDINTWNDWTRIETAPFLIPEGTLRIWTVIYVQEAGRVYMGLPQLQYGEQASAWNNDRIGQSGFIDNTRMFVRQTNPYTEGYNLRVGDIWIHW